MRYSAIPRGCSPIATIFMPFFALQRGRQKGRGSAAIAAVPSTRLHHHRLVFFPTASAIALLTSGCISLAPAIEEPSLIAELPAAYDTSVVAGDYSPAAWWTAFEDPTLDRLVNDALQSNLDIVEAVGRMEQASTQARISSAALFPTTTASASGTETSTPIDGLSFGNLAGGAIDRIDNEAYTLSLGASYELDFFGRARDDFRASGKDAQASVFDLKTVQLSVAAETITAYFDLVDTRRQIELTKHVSAVLADRAARTEERFERGLAESFELYQVRQELRSSQASIPQLESALISHRARLAILLGAYPKQFDDRISGPLRPRLVFEPVPAGLPAELLDQRPDIAAAWARLDAARLRIGARKAERFPRLSLSASLGTQAGEPGNVFDFASNWTSALAASVVAPIFDAGRISASIRSARAVYDQRAANYSQTVLSAYVEVDRAIADYEEQRLRYLLITSQLAEAQSSLNLQRMRFSSGVGSYLTYLDSLSAVYQIEANLSSAARVTALARLGIHRALGGDWIVPPDLPNPVQGQTGQGESS